MSAFGAVRLWMGVLEGETLCPESLLPTNNPHRIFAVRPRFSMPVGSGLRAIPRSGLDGRSGNKHATIRNGRALSKGPGYVALATC
jgi:hypothetical protein